MKTIIALAVVTAFLAGCSLELEEERVTRLYIYNDYPGFFDTFDTLYVTPQGQPTGASLLDAPPESAQTSQAYITPTNYFKTILSECGRTYDLALTVDNYDDGLSQWVTHNFEFNGLQVACDVDYLWVISKVTTGATSLDDGCMQTEHEASRNTDSRLVVQCPIRSSYE